MSIYLKFKRAEYSEPNPIPLHFVNQTLNTYITHK